MRRLRARPALRVQQLVLLAVGAAFSGGCGRVGYDAWTDETHRATSDRGGLDGSASEVSTSPGNDGTGGARRVGVLGADAASSGGATETGGTAGTGSQMNIGGAATSGGSGPGDAGTGRGAGGSAVSDGGAGGASSTGGTAGTGGSNGCVVTNGGVERCDGVDNDCNTLVDEGAVCGSQCTGSTYGGHAYAFCSNPLDFADATADCQSKSMRLARIDDAAENQFLASLAFAATGGQNTPSIWPWFGAHDGATPVQWTFLDGTVFWSGKNNGTAVGGLYSNWAAAAPGDASGTYCATLSHSGTLTWVDRGCSNLQPRLCEAY